MKTIIWRGKSRAYRAINANMLETYWNLGKCIAEQEWQNKERAGYSVYLIENLSKMLAEEFGKGYSAGNLRDFRKFYTTFSDNEIYRALCSEPQLAENRKTEIQRAPHGEFNAAFFGNLSWSHIRSIMRIANPQAMLWYLKEANEQMWSIRTLDRNIGSQYYERMLLTQHQDLVQKEMLEKTAEWQTDNLEFIRNPVIAEFLGFSQNTDFTESDLEKSILSNLEQFVLELGKGFAFVARQQHVRTEERDYFIDLVFYNYILKCFVLIELKTRQISYQDVGQMDMYVQMYDRMKRTESDNPTIGIILCSETDKDVARYSILGKSGQLFASKYKLYLPTEEELRREIERQKEIYRLQQENKRYL
jgi:predicted nuclease of restriction endonuclease-like (RecB) superfamily